MLVASYGDETTVLARVLPSVCNVGILERLASVDVLPLFNTAFPLVNSCALLKKHGSNEAGQYFFVVV